MAVKMVINYDGKVYESVPEDSTAEEIKEMFYVNWEVTGKMFLKTEKGIVFFGEDVVKSCVVEIVEVA